MNRRHEEMVETLAGARRHDAPRRAAVRIEDLAALLEILPRPRSAPAAGATPTKAEHDALVADVHDLHRLLSTVAGALQNRIIG